MRCSGAQIALQKGGGELELGVACLQACGRGEPAPPCCHHRVKPGQLAGLLRRVALCRPFDALVHSSWLRPRPEADIPGRAGLRDRDFLRWKGKGLISEWNSWPLWTLSSGPWVGLTAVTDELS